MHRIGKNTLLLLVAQISSRALAIVYIAALARYVGTDGIGKISTATSFISLMALILWPGLDPLLIRNVAADNHKASQYTSNLFATRILLGIPFLFLVMLISHVNTYSADTIRIIIVYALVYLVDGLCEIFTSLFRAFQRMEYEASTQVARDILNITLSLFAIFFRLPLIAIVLMSLVAQICKFILMWVLSSHRFVRISIAINLRTMKTIFISSLPFGGLVILYTLQSQLGTFVLSLSHPSTTVGIFSAANTLITTLVLIPGALSSSILPAFSKLNNEAPKDLPHLYSLSFKYLLILGFPLGIGTMLVGDHVILLIYGREFEGSMVVLRVLALFLLTFVTYSNGPLLYATGRERFFAQTLVISVCAYGLLCFLLIPIYGPIGAAIAYVTTGLVTTSIYSIICHRLLNLTLPWMTIGKITLAAALMGLATMSTLRLGINWLLVTLLIAPGCYIVLLFLLRLVGRNEVQNILGLSKFR
jgi:O-antigen/teichoic acid export membrane protein